jgi:hypothetical protein
VSLVDVALPVETQPLTTPRRVSPHALGVAIEAALVAGFYQWYSVARYLVGGSTAAAQRNAMHVVAWERALGIFNESSVQAAVIAHPVLVHAAAYYYGTAHFIVPAVALVVLYRRDRGRYVTCRNALAWTSVLAVAAFALFPTMPPRLLGPAFHFTGVTAPGLDRAVVPALYNGFAAMPSLHAAYSSWAVAALWPVLRSWWARALLVAHFVVTVTVVIVTANHFYLDVVGGVVVMAIGAVIARRRASRSPRGAAMAAGILLAAAVLIWLPRAAGLPLVLDVAGGVGILVAAIISRDSSDRSQTDTAPELTAAAP